MKKLLSLLFLVSVLFATSPIFAASSTGDKPSDWAKASVGEAITRGIVPQRLQSKYQSPITREEFAELIVKTIFAKVKDNAARDGLTEYWTEEKLLDRVDLDIEFEDAKQSHIKLAYIIGSINGVSETKFAPNKHITRQEAATMLVNTSHIVNNINYTSKEKLAYSDFNKIAAWAKPAVQAAASVGFMQGVGGKFDYAGKFTREQSIATMLRLYDSPYDLALRGNIIAEPAYGELRYNVGKSYIKVSYHDDGTYSELEKRMKSLWTMQPYLKESKDQFSMEKAVAIFAFARQTKPADYPDIIGPTVNGRTSKWDYGWMDVSIFNSDSVIQFEFKPIQGYMTESDVYQYGYPFRPVKLEEIKV